MFIIQRAFLKSYYCQNIRSLLGYSVVKNVESLLKQMHCHKVTNALSFTKCEMPSQSKIIWLYAFTLYLT